MKYWLCCKTQVFKTPGPTLNLKTLFDQHLKKKKQIDKFEIQLFWMYCIISISGVDSYNEMLNTKTESHNNLYSQF